MHSSSIKLTRILLAGYVIPSGASGAADSFALYVGSLNLSTCSGCSTSPSACPVTVGSSQSTLRPAQTMASMMSFGTQTCSFLPAPLSFTSSLPFPGASQQSITCSVAGSYLLQSITIDNAFWGVQRLYDIYVQTVAIQSLSSAWVLGSSTGNITLQVIHCSKLCSIFVMPAAFPDSIWKLLLTCQRHEQSWQLRPELCPSGHISLPSATVPTMSIPAMC